MVSGLWFIISALRIYGWAEKGLLQPGIWVPGRNIDRIFYCLLFTFSLHASIALVSPYSVQAQQVYETSSTDDPLAVRRAYLPLLIYQPSATDTSAIWVAVGASAAHEVGLFRHSFSIQAPIGSTSLSIFADTRYELWVDGVWKGRGPARFSRQTREYDVYDLGNLSAGKHLIAVLVQWAPNQRRSESLVPFVQAEVRVSTGQGDRVVDRTNPQWKAWRAMAWRPDAVPVHTWGLLGPTELLDLRQLPADWMLPGFDDNAWPAAVGITPPAATHQPRSLPFLDQVAIPATVLATGLISPGRAMAELVPKSADPYTLTLSTLQQAVFDLEMLDSALLSQSVQLDGTALTWQALPERHPDIRRATRVIAPGTHLLRFSDLPAQGLTLSLDQAGLSLPALPFEQGVHAGRRLLLADFQADPTAVSVTPENGLNFGVTRLPAYIVLDLGRVVHGRVTAKVSGPAGTILDMGWDERLWQVGWPLPCPGSLHSEWNQVDSWVLAGNQRQISTIDARSGRYLLIAVWGKGPVQINHLQVYEERYPVTQQGNFQSADARLNSIWQVGVNTLYPSMNDAYADPWRERGQWWGDAYVIDHVNQVAFGDTRVLRRGLLFMAEAFTAGRPNALAPSGSAAHMLDYGMLWVQSIDDYMRQTGDQTLLLDVYPTLIEFMQYLETYRHAETGLLDIPLAHWSETVYLDSSVFYDRYGQSTAVNALYYATLLNAATLAEQSGDSLNALAWRNQAATLKMQMNNLLYQPDRGRYVQTIFQGTVFAPSPHAQAWALAYGLVPDDQVPHVADALVELIAADPSTPNVQIYGMFWVLEGLAHANRHADALAIINRYYGRLLDLGATTWWENFNAHRSYTNSLSHGWGGAPTWFLTTHLLGTRRTGVHTWSVQPALSGVVSAEGSLPLPSGNLQVRWQQQSCARSQVAITAPPGTTGDLRIRQTNPSQVVALNDTVVWKDDAAQVDGVFAQQGTIYLTLAEGLSLIQIEQTCHSIYLPVIVTPSP